MCRWSFYKGKKTLIGSIISSPENSLLQQSLDAAWHPGVKDPSHRRNIRVNGDGFGIAWYDNKPETGSCLFKFVTPAWSDSNLRDISDHISSPLIFGHIRAASDSVHDPEHNPLRISYENCHPFKFGRWTFMHNGAIPEFQKIRLLILNLVSNDIFVKISGSTDSEYIFALFLHLLGKEKRQSDYEISISDFTETIEATISTVLQLMYYTGITSKSSMNMAITNGVHVVATRFRGNVLATEEPPSLYYCMGEEFAEQEGYFRCPSMFGDGSEDSDGCADGGCGGGSCNRTREDDPVCRTDGWKQPNTHITHACAGASASASFAAGFRRDALCRARGLVVSSAPLGREDSNTDKHWTLVPRSCMLVCKGDYSDVSEVESVTMQCIHVCPENAVLGEVVMRYHDTVCRELCNMSLYEPMMEMLKQPYKYNMTDSNRKWGKIGSSISAESGESSPAGAGRGFVSADGCRVSKSCCDFLLLESNNQAASDASGTCEMALVQGQLHKITHKSISFAIENADATNGTVSSGGGGGECSSSGDGDGSCGGGGSCGGPAPSESAMSAEGEDTAQFILCNEGYRMISPLAVIDAQVQLANNKPFTVLKSATGGKSPTPPPSPVVGIVDEQEEYKPGDDGLGVLPAPIPMPFTISSTPVQTAALVSEDGTAGSVSSDNIDSELSAPHVATTLLTTKITTIPKVHEIDSAEESTEKSESIGSSENEDNSTIYVISDVILRLALVVLVLLMLITPLTDDEN